MGKIKGGDLILSKDGTAIAHTTSFTLNISQDLPEATDMDSNAWSEFLGGQRSWTISFDGLTDWAANGNVDTLADMIIDDARTAESITFSTDVTGDTNFSGSAFLSSFDISASNNETVSYSGEFQGTGPLTKSVNV